MVTPVAAPPPVPPAPLTPEEIALQRRTSLNGCWLLDRNRGTPSMRSYLETMGVNELAIQAHEKGETERDTYHTIELLEDKKIKIVKRSRVNNDIVVELEVGKESVEYLPPGQREKRVLAQSTSPDNLIITSSLMTVNGLANVVDKKELLQEETMSVLKQELTITNAVTQQSHATVRFFVPYIKTPPHVEDALMADVAAAATTAAK